MNHIASRLWILVMITASFLAGVSLADADELIRSPHDARAHEFLLLPNGLRVMLVSDAEADMAAAALDVRVGHFDDPPERQGLAHFLEHMLFLGTERYPDPGDYRDYISRHGGRANAMTGTEHTVYFFDVAPGHLEGALDRFAQFFIAPLFTEALVERERKAVDSEYRLRLRDDARRLNDAIKESINPAHPYAKFSTGSLETLADREREKAREAVIEFYRTHYSADRMTLAVVGPYPLAVLRRMVEERFGSIARLQPAGTGRAGATPPLRRSGASAERLDVIPFREQRHLRLDFTFPWMARHALTKPAVPVAYLLGHEGHGSLHHELTRRGWISGLSAGGSRFSPAEGLFTLSVDLTPEGLEHVDTIAELAFGAIALIRREGIDEALHEELSRMRALDFRYRETARPRAEAMMIASNLHTYPESHALAGPYLMAAFHAGDIQTVLDALRPDNVRVTVVAPGLETSRRSQWYDTPYHLEPLPEATVTRWARAEPPPALTLPGPNPFLPTRTALKTHGTDAADRPRLVLEQPGVRIWQVADREFRVPRADLFVNIETEAAVAGPREAILTAIWLALIRESLEPDTYPARMAGLHHDLYATDRGIGLAISGYDDKQALLALLIVDRLMTHEPEAASFRRHRETLERRLDNARLNAPYQLLPRELDDLLQPHRWAPEALLEAARAARPDDLRALLPTLLGQLRIEVLLHGNVTALEATEVGREIAERLLAPGVRPGPSVARAVARLAPGVAYLRSVETHHEDAATLVHYQAPDARTATAARLLMLEQVLKTPFFESLRTEQQLGYVVQTYSTAALRLPGLNFLIQSSTHGPQALAERIDRFLSAQRTALATLDAERFEHHRQGLLSRLRERDTTLRERSLRLQASLALHDHGFDRRERLAAEVEQLTLADVIGTHEKLLLSEERRRIVLQAAGPEFRQARIVPGEAWVQVTERTAFLAPLDLHVLEPAATTLADVADRAAGRDGSPHTPREEPLHDDP